MCKAISFISGKGGSGKTTLALSMASLLSSCGIKTLLIDCDLSTNGATYFYEDKLTIKNKNILSFYDMLYNESNKKTNFVTINSHLDFVPSITQITKKSTKIYTHKNDNKLFLYDDIHQKYDVVLFDCQAGYTDILKLVLPLSDINLTVMETDAISSAAMRSLYLKIGDIINDRKIYQVFNKASREEYETYSKVSGGTVFTNIETIIFDWKIRKAFSVSQIPDMENTSANYGEQIFSICSVLFSNEALQSKLVKFRTILDIHAAQEKESLLRRQISELKIKYKKKGNKLRRSFLLITTLALLFIFAVILIIMMDNRLFDDIPVFSIIPIVLSILSMLTTSLTIFDMTKEKRDYETEIHTQQEELERVLINLTNLQKKLEDNEIYDKN